MSSIATKPSARLTTVADASPETILQKMQSLSGSEDSFLRDGGPANADQLPDRRLDEPRRVVVAVATSGTVDEHQVVAADLLAPAAPACVVGESAQAGPALP